MIETEPRKLTDVERDVLAFMLSIDVHGIEELRAQMHGLLAYRDCKCPCPSISFVVDEAAPRSELATGHTRIDACGSGERGLILFLGEGRLKALECYFYEDARNECPLSPTSHPRRCTRETRALGRCGRARYLRACWPLGADARRVAGAQKQLAWCVDAESHFEAMTAYYAFRGYGQYSTIHEWDRTSYATNGLAAQSDIAFLPETAAQAAILEGGEARWPVSSALEVMRSLTETGNGILGVDIRDYADDGTFVEVAWADVSVSADPLKDAEEALGRPNLPGQWALITWGRRPNPLSEQRYCDWCYADLSEASTADSIAIGLDREYSAACATCISTGRYVVAPEDWVDVELPWPFE